MSWSLFSTFWATLNCQRQIIFWYFCFGLIWRHRTNAVVLFVIADSEKIFMYLRTCTCAVVLPTNLEAPSEYQCIEIRQFFHVSNSTVDPLLIVSIWSLVFWVSGIDTFLRGWSRDWEFTHSNRDASAHPGPSRATGCTSSPLAASFRKREALTRRWRHRASLATLWRFGNKCLDSWSTAERSLVPRVFKNNF